MCAHGEWPQNSGPNFYVVLMSFTFSYDMLGHVLYCCISGCTCVSYARRSSVPWLEHGSYYNTSYMHKTPQADAKSSAVQLTVPQVNPD
jgi:hypothetical protein